MSQRTWLLSSACVAALLLAVDTGAAQSTLPPGLHAGPGGQVINPGARVQIIKPASSLARPGHLHTNLLLAVPSGGYPQFKQNGSGPPQSGNLAETPASLMCVYELGVGGQSVGCDPNQVSTVVSGGSKAIAVVDAYDYGASVAASDVAAFDSQFGVASVTLNVIYGTGSPGAGCANGAQPSSSAGTGWDLEAALDMEISHALAPKATLYLVEANSSSFTDLFNAIQVASACVAGAGGGQVSMSFGGSEFSGETSLDADFTGSGVEFFASAGDQSGTQYPCVSPAVVCVGGTTISRSGANGAFQSELVWNSNYDDVGTGGGLSQFEGAPSYQGFMSGIVGNHRGVPDLSADADPLSGLWIYNTSYCAGFCIIGGTSLSSPLLAGLFNFANFFYVSSTAMVNNIYQIGQNGVLKPFVTHINSGACGYAYLDLSGKYPNAENPEWDPANTFAVTGIPWSECNGWGTPKDSGNPDFLRAMMTGH
jgi:kumamolisin